MATQSLRPMTPAISPGSQEVCDECLSRSRALDPEVLWASNGSLELPHSRARKVLATAAKGCAAIADVRPSRSAS